MGGTLQIPTLPGIPPYATDAKVGLIAAKVSYKLEKKDQRK